MLNYRQYFPKSAAEYVYVKEGFNNDFLASLLVV